MTGVQTCALPISYLGIQLDVAPEIVYVDPYHQIAGQFQNMFRTFQALFRSNSGIGIQHLSGPIGITHAFYTITQVDWRLGIWLAILLNVNLAIINLFPFPILDGGHILFATWERFICPVSEKLQVRLTNAMLAVLLTIILVVTYNDILRLF